MSITLKEQVNGVTQTLDKFVAKSRQNFVQFFERDAIPKYLAAQTKRFESENNSDYAQGGWIPLNEKYAEDKLKRFAKYEGGGRHMLIATGKLSKSVLALSTDYRQVVGDTSMAISTVVPYAGFVDAVRSYTTFTPNFYTELSNDLRVYVGKL